MKTLTYFILSVLCICIIGACDVNQSGPDQGDINKAPENAAFGTDIEGNGKEIRGSDHSRGRHWQVIPFEGSFFTTPEGNPRPDKRCSPPALLDTQSGNGKAKYLGPLQFHSTFCIDLSDILPPLGGDGKLTAGEALPFYGSETTFTFANGDKLYARGNDAVLPSDNPEYNAEFSNPFVIIGGTGRFEGAQGGGTTNSLVKFGIGTDHEFSGVLVLPIQRGVSDSDD